MQIHEALNQLSEIHGHLSRSRTFRGYRAATIGASGILAFVVAALQSSFVPNPSADVEAWLLLWIAVAGINVTATFVELWLRSRRPDASFERKQTREALAQFSPCVIVGALLTLVLWKSSRESLWMLPGLWAIVFSLGVFSSRPILPRQSIWSGCWYLMSGLAVLLLARDESAFAPWAMAVTFGGGQLVTATILYFFQERSERNATGAAS